MDIIGIDPGTDGSISILWQSEIGDKPPRISWVLSFKDPEWKSKLNSLLTCHNHSGIPFYMERVHSKRGNGVKGTWTFAENYGALKTILEMHGVKWIDLEPNTWMLALGLPKHRNIIDSRKRREARRKSQEAWALQLFPNLAHESGDVFASALIAYSQVVKDWPQAKKIEQALRLNGGQLNAD